MPNTHRNEPEKPVPSLEKAQHVFEQSRDQARDAARQAAQSIEANPIGVLVGGLVVGAIAAALIPRSDKERELLAPVGKRISTTATAALAAAKENGMAELEARGLTRDGARDQARQLFEGVTKAMASAGQAGLDAARNKSA
ncbi:hypothetical protein [Sphingomonas bacterium]|uniref:hypothetical protein n=1 Tax=Sphingomonas bacterium TaxID=1895847 RepID=UPI0015758CF5|nr:hypothetical protein [Sphingomonas bacterium]